jgi:hypothetical protein
MMIFMIAAGGLIFMASLFAYLTRDRWQKVVQKGPQTRVDYTADKVLSFREIKDAYRSGRWLRDTGWVALTLVMLGALVMSVGLLGLVFIIATPGVKLILAGVAVYAAARTAWAFVRA